MQFGFRHARSGTSFQSDPRPDNFRSRNWVISRGNDNSFLTSSHSNTLLSVSKRLVFDKVEDRKHPHTPKSGTRNNRYMSPRLTPLTSKMPVVDKMSLRDIIQTEGRAMRATSVALP